MERDENNKRCCLFTRRRRCTLAGSVVCSWLSAVTLTFIFPMTPVPSTWLITTPSWLANPPTSVIQLFAFAPVSGWRGKIPSVTCPRQLGWKRKPRAPLPPLTNGVSIGISARKVKNEDFESSTANNDSNRLSLKVVDLFACQRKRAVDKHRICLKVWVNNNFACEVKSSKADSELLEWKRKAG